MSDEDVDIHTNFDVGFSGVSDSLAQQTTVEEVILGESLLTPGLQTSVRVHSSIHELPVKNLDEYKDTTKIIIPAYIAKQIVLDLMSGDSAKSQLTILYDMYKATEQKTKVQDSMVGAYQVKNQAYAKQILLYKEKEVQYIDYTKNLKKDVKKAKLKNHLATGAGMLAILGGILFLFVSSGK
jgi:hypothetical protein